MISRIKTKQNKKAAIELSIGTVVIIVLAMTMLILGLVLVQKIMGGATDTVDTLNDRVRAQITSLFTESGSKIAIKLGADKLAKIKQGTSEFGIAIGAQTQNAGNAIDASGNPQLFYEVTLQDTSAQGSCGQVAASWFAQPKITSGVTSEQVDFRDVEGNNGYAIIYITVPKGTAQCSQNVQIKTYESSSRTFVASASFRIQVISGGIFG